jgi:transposase InsO family protein
MPVLAYFFINGIITHEKHRFFASIRNGKQESFYQKFKLELGHPMIYETRGELIEAIALQIHYYNHRRIHSALKMPPAIFYQRCLRQNQTAITKKPSEISAQN